MANIALAMKSRGSAGEPLPGVFMQLERLGAKIRRSQVTLIAAAPGGGKSAVASHIAVNADYTGRGDGVPTLYFSADTDEHTLGTRVGAGLLEKSLEEVEEMAKEDEDTLADVLGTRTPHVSWCFDKAPTLDDIEQELEAYAIVNGEYPHMTVIDNLMDVIPDSGGMATHEAHDAAIDFFAQLARKTQSAFVVLCHVVGAYEDGDVPIPLSGLMGKVGKRPRLVLTLYQIDQMHMGISVVKNSSGAKSTNGQGVLASIGWMPARSYFVDGRS